MSEISDLKSEPSDCRARLDEETEGCGRGKAQNTGENFCGKVTPGGDSVIPISKDLRDDLHSLLMIRLFRSISSNFCTSNFPQTKNKP